MPTIAQMRAARALLDWSQSDLADKAGLSQTGIARIENDTNQPNSSTLEKIGTAFDAADVEFINDSGVKKRKGEIRTLKGVEGFKTFMNEIYEHAQTHGGEFCLHNARPENWHKWLGAEWFQMHSKRMANLDTDINFKITAEEGNTDLISDKFAEYRWFPIDLFNDQSIYAFGDKLAFIHFGEDTVSVDILENNKFAEGFRILFNVAWNNVAIEIPNK